MCNICNRNCNDKCKPTCNPCNNQPHILYCGQPIECLDVKRGDLLNGVIKKLGDKVCQLVQLGEIYTYTNIIEATEEQCEHGGFVFQEISYSTGEIESETIICNIDSTIGFYLNEELIGNANNININEGEGIQITAVYDELGNIVNYTFSTFPDCISITYQEGLDLIQNEEVQCGVLYYVTDRNYFLNGLDSTNFSIRGHRLQKIIKTEYYFEQSGTEVKGVYNNLVGITSASTGDLFIRGGKLWEATTTIPSLNITSQYTMGTGFQEKTDDDFYETVLFEIEYDYINDFVIKQTDVYNNSILGVNVNTGVFGVQNSTNFADWGQLKSVSGRTIKNNIFSRYFNNRIQNNSGIELNNITQCHENDISALVDNKISNTLTTSRVTAYYNKAVSVINIKTSTNSFLNLSNNTIEGNITNNICDNILENISGGIFGNTINNIISNKVSGINNNNPASISNFSNISRNSGASILNNEVNDISDNIVTGSIQDNTDIDFINYNISTSIGYNNGAVGDTGSLPNITRNIVTVSIDLNNLNSDLIENSCHLITDNNNCRIEYNTDSITEIARNQGGRIISNSNIGTISDNTTSIILTNSNTGSITYNTNCLIEKNTNNGAIYFNNRNTPVASYNITLNVNNGDIANNQPTTTGLSITTNINNGYIGGGSTVSRSTTIFDTVSNK